MVFRIDNLSIYTDGKYLSMNKSWHVEDSPWKAEQIFNIIRKNNISINNVCEVGCGAGQILNHLSFMLQSDISYTGYEISPQAYQLCQQIENSKIHFFMKDITKDNTDHFDLILLIDIIEHLENYYDFLRIIKEKSRYQILNIPLELWIKSIFPSELLKSRQNLGHLHFFNKEIGLAVLHDTGFKIIDYSLTPSFQNIDNSDLFTKLLWVPRKILYSISEDACSHIFGGSSLLVLTQSNNNPS